MTEDTAKSNIAHKIEAIKTLFQLWSNENNVKTQKLALFFTAQSILAAAYALGPGTQYLIPSVGMAFSLVWFFSLGRTVAYQKAWKQKIEILMGDAPELVRKEFDLFPTPEEKKKMPLYGKVSSKYVVLLPPAAGFLLWLGIFVYTLAL